VAINTYGAPLYPAYMSAPSRHCKPRNLSTNGMTTFRMYLLGQRARVPRITYASGGGRTITLRFAFRGWQRGCNV